jgi:hypothetical protein
MNTDGYVLILVALLILLKALHPLWTYLLDRQEAVLFVNKKDLLKAILKMSKYTGSSPPFFFQYSLGNA